MARSSSSKKRISLALQGGGSHGAFTWGVLDRLAEEDKLEISAISATSAGAGLPRRTKPMTMLGANAGCTSKNRPSSANEVMTSLMS